MPLGALRVRLPQLAAALVIAIFVLANARGLDAVPMINEDESWIAAPGVHFFETGRFATPLFAGYFKSEQHYYDFMPLYALLDGAAIRLFGLTLVTVRGLSVTCGALTLLLTFMVGRRLFSAWHGVLALCVLVFWPIAATGMRPYLSLSTGIPLTDLARIGRYDILVPVLGLTSLLAVLRAMSPGKQAHAWSLGAGALAALAFLTHYYGALWLLAAVALVLNERGRRGVRTMALIAVGFGVTLTPWLWFISRDFATFVEQKQAQASRYGIGAATVADEWSRYSLITRAIESGNLATVAWVVLVAAGAVLLIRRGWAGPRDHGARVLTIVLAVLAAGLTVLVRRRLFNYLGTLWPLFALTASFALLYPWTAPLRTAGRAMAAALVAIVSWSGIAEYRQLDRRASTSGSYAAVCERIVQQLPSDARLLALQHWWIGVAPHVADYRSFIVPLTRMNPLESAHPITFAEAMQIDPRDYILIDPEMADVLKAAGDPARPKAGPFAVEIKAYLENRAVEVDTFDDPAYGRFTLYRVRP